MLLQPITCNPCLYLTCQLTLWKFICRIFGLIQSCNTSGRDATLERVTYTSMRPQTQIIDLASISCVVGQVKIGRGDRWGIVDRSKDLVQPSFIEDPELVEEMD